MAKLLKRLGLILIYLYLTFLIFFIYTAFRDYYHPQWFKKVADFLPLKELPLERRLKILE
jgi:hypothetical protein